MSNIAWYTKGVGEHHTMLLHGFLGSGQNLKTLARSWSEVQRNQCFVVVDLPGHGDSSPLPPDPCLRDLAEPLLKICAEMHIHDLVGHSLGGRVALEMLSLRPDLINNVTLLDISPSPTSHISSPTSAIVQSLLGAPRIVQSRDVMVDFFTQDDLPITTARWLTQNIKRGPKGNYTWCIDRENLDTLHRNAGQESKWDIVEAMPERIACIRGGKSPFVSLNTIQQFQNLGVRCDSINHAGHFLHIDAPKTLVGMLLNLN
jgi:esterase